MVVCPADSLLLSIGEEGWLRIRYQDRDRSDCFQGIESYFKPSLATYVLDVFATLDAISAWSRRGHPNPYYSSSTQEGSHLTEKLERCLILRHAMKLSGGIVHLYCFNCYKSSMRTVRYETLSSLERRSQRAACAPCTWPPPCRRSQDPWSRRCGR